VLAHELYAHDLWLILIFAILELWLIQLWIDCLQSSGVTLKWGLLLLKFPHVIHQYTFQPTIGTNPSTALWGSMEMAKPEGLQAEV